ncbi:uncharacterized protein LOC135385574 isoform X2 [Ornithodoros turicata]|uniref:uncharacterized protein LOC135385574 isoform X2 n=1 Tax=Ornithodoros turicata TaxID=34597 RepID=UPI00313A4C7F
MSSTPSRRDRKRKPKAKLSFGSSNGSSGNLPSNMCANLPELFQLLKIQNEELEVSSQLNGNMLHSFNGMCHDTTEGIQASSKRESFSMEREVVGSKPEVSLLREDNRLKALCLEELYSRENSGIEELVEKTRSLLRAEGPLEERDILKGIGLNQDQIALLLPTTLGAHLVGTHKGFQCAKEGPHEYFYYCSDDDDDDIACDNSDRGTSVKSSGITTTTTTTSTNTLASSTATIGTNTVEHHNLPAGCKSWCMALENSSCSNSAYESAEDEEAWAMPRSATPLSVGSGMSPPPVVRAPVVSHNQETQTEPPTSLWRTVGVMTDTTSSASVQIQTDQPDEAAVLKMALKKRDIDISDLQEALHQQSHEHREEIQQLHNKISKLQVQLQKVAEEKQASPPLPSVKKQASSKEPEIHSLLIEPKRETVSLTTNGDRKASDKNEFRDFYEIQMKMDQQSGGGSCSDPESMWSSRGGSPKGSKKSAQEENIIRRLKREKPNFTEAHIREYLNKFREEQCGLTGMTVKAIVAGILALMKSDSLSTDVLPHMRKRSAALLLVERQGQEFELRKSSCRKGAKLRSVQDCA